MGDLLAGVHPGLILVDGEEELSTLVAERFPRCCRCNAACGTSPVVSTGSPTSSQTTSPASSKRCSPLPTGHDHGVALDA